MGRTIYVPENERIWVQYFLNQAIQTGHGMDGFQGLPYQRGHGLGSFFARLFRSILPMAKRVGKAALKNVGKEALSMGANVAGDLVKGRQFEDSITDHGRMAAGNLLHKAGRSLKRKKGGQSGGSIGRQSVVSKTRSVNPRKKPRKTKKRKITDIFAKYNV